MLANKYHWEEDGRTVQNSNKESIWNRILRIDPEEIVENMTGIMFKAILIFGIPYFLFVLIRFLMIH